MSWETSSGVNYLYISSKSGCLLGGQGSGGHNSKGKRRDVQCARLDVHELTREGKLKLGTRGRLFGVIGFEVTGGPNAQHLVLEFPCRSASGEPLEPVRQDILCYWRKAHYGPHLVFQVPQMCWHHLSVHNGPPVGPLGASY